MMPQASLALIAAMKAAEAKAEEEDSLTNRVQMDEMYKDDGSPRISEQELEQIFVSRSDSVPSPPSQDDNTMEIEVSTETARNLAILFGEEDSNSVDNTIEEGSKIKIPYWLGKMLYDASQGRKVPDYFPEFQAAAVGDSGIDADLALALELQQLEEEDQQMEGVQKKLKNEMLAEEMKSKFGHSNAKRVLASADNPSPEAAAINELCARYPEIERKYIKIIAGRCSYNVAKATAKIKQFSNGFLPEAKEKEFSFIVPSQSPHPIFERRTSVERFPNMQYMDENGRSLVTQDDIKNLRDNADTIISERIPHYQKLAHDNPIPSVRGFYLDLIKRAKEEIERLNVESDLYEIYIHRDSREIDLHGKDPVRAQKAVVNKINFCHEKRPNFRKLLIITGRGKTTGGPAILREYILKFLLEKDLNVSIIDGNDGALELNMSSVRDFIG